jgi:hypothetical protein
VICIVFTSPVYGTENIHRTEPQSSLFPVAVAHIWDQLQLPVAMFCKYLKTKKDQFRPVSTGLSSHHVLDLTHVQFDLIFGP